jgi:hypothetical protein
MVCFVISNDCSIYYSLYVFGEYRRIFEIDLYVTNHAWFQRILLTPLLWVVMMIICQSFFIWKYIEIIYIFLKNLILTLTNQNDLKI